ncbi:MAG: disulfide bond formation protein B [Crocinitomicaceae bacterium]|nr:disulfide bond formation protein B [Crocinitomicaceae bacterium]
MKLLKYLNSACILIVCSILLGALYFQFGLSEDPCPLCLLQRMGMIGVIFGLSLNVFFGFDAKHFSVVIVSALIGILFSGRQVLLHICPVDGDTGYGTPFFGMHLYSWGVLIFVASILGSALFLLFHERFKRESNPTPLNFERYSVYLATLIIFVNVIATVFECQLGPCCENGPCT